MLEKFLKSLDCKVERHFCPPPPSHKKKENTLPTSSTTQLTKLCLNIQKCSILVVGTLICAIFSTFAEHFRTTVQRSITSYIKYFIYILLNNICVMISGVKNKSKFPPTSTKVESTGKIYFPWFIFHLILYSKNILQPSIWDLLILSKLCL